MTQEGDGKVVAQALAGEAWGPFRRLESAAFRPSSSSFAPLLGFLGHPLDLT